MKGKVQWYKMAQGYLKMMSTLKFQCKNCCMSVANCWILVFPSFHLCSQNTPTKKTPTASCSALHRPNSKWGENSKPPNLHSATRLDLLHEVLQWSISTGYTRYTGIVCEYYTITLRNIDVCQITICLQLQFIECMHILWAIAISVFFFYSITTHGF